MTIDLSKGWDGATSCIIPLVGGTECFSTLAQAQAAANAISQAELSSTTSGGANARHGATAHPRRAVGHGGACAGNSGEWLWLYQNANYGGASVGIQETDVWMDLSNIGFADEMSSYSNDTGCTVYMSQQYNGSGPRLTVSPWASSSYVGSTWNDKVVTVYISY